MKKDLSKNGGGPRLGIVSSIALHALVIGALFLLPNSSTETVAIIAAGEGEGGEGGGGPIDVGVADASVILGFAKAQPVSYVGDTDDAINNARLESIPREDENPDEVLPEADKESDPTAIKTDRPVANQQERIFRGKDERGRSATDSIQQGRTYGSAVPTEWRGGIGIGTGSGSGAGSGLPGGSAYGRLIQSILSRNYNPRADDSGSYIVIIAVKIARDGKILSYNFKQQSPSFLINKAAERAIIASNPLPPFPSDFLPRAQAVSADLLFRYPK